MSHPTGIKAIEEEIGTTLQNLTKPKRSHAFWGFWAVVGLAFVLLWLRHGNWLQDPNAFLFGESPDGFKNYMTTTWHVRHDSSYVHYGGMNYPYGEHVLFTDNQPILSAGMQWWSRHVDDLSGRTVGLVNMMQFWSLLIGAGVLFLLLHRLHLPVWYAGLAAVGILLLSPQYIRFDGHFGLSHTWVFPLLLLLLYRYEVRHSRRYQSLQIGVLVWFAAQLHFYYLGLAALFLGLYTLFQLINEPTFRNFRVRISHLVVMVLLPFMLLNVWIHWTNYSTGRPANPYGFTTYIGYWEGIFLPYEQFPLYQWLDNNVIKIRRVDFETQAYIGMVAFGFTIWAIFWRQFRVFDPAWDEMAHHRIQKRYLYGIFTAALLLLLFACGFPFAIKGMDWMVRFFGPLRQFRGLGRFTWAFYYVINILAFYVLWHKSLHFKGFSGARFPWFRWVIVLAPLVLLGYEAYIFQTSKKLTLRENVAQREVFAKDPNHWLNKVDFTQFQALLPLPYYHVGSENIWLDFDFRHYTKVQTTALHTGVPDMGVNMSRTPVDEMVKSVQLVHTPGQLPGIVADLPNNLPIALLIEPGRWDDVQRRYRHLVAHATPVYDGPELRILSLALDSLRLAVRETAREVTREMAVKNAVTTGAWQSERAPGWLWSQTFDSLTTSPQIFQGKGAYTGLMSDTTWLWKNHIPKGQYYLSMWIYVQADMGMTHEVKLIENARSDGHEIHFQHEGLRFYLREIVDGWALFDLPFEVNDENANLSIFLQKKGVELPFSVDEVLIKRANATVYRRSPGWISRDNFWYQTSGN